MFITNRKLHYVHNFPGFKPEQRFVSSELKSGKYTLGDGVHPGECREVPRVGQKKTLRRRESSRRGTNARTDWQVHAVGRRASASPTTVAPQSPRTTRRPEHSRAGRSSLSASRSSRGSGPIWRRWQRQRFIRSGECSLIQAYVHTTQSCRKTFPLTFGSSFVTRRPKIRAILRQIAPRGYLNSGPCLLVNGFTRSQGQRSLREASEVAIA